MKGPFKRFDDATDSAYVRIQESLDRVDTAAMAVTVAVALVGLVAVTALLLAAALAESR